jgi:lysophospholipase L1-like esterase
MTSLLMSIGLNDAILAMGDSITLGIWGGAGATPSYGTLIYASHAPHSGVISNQGVGGQTSTAALSTIDGLIQSNPNCATVTLAWGTNDCYAGHVGVSTFTSNMQSLINTVLASGRIPIIPTIPYSPDANMANLPSYNAVITGTLYAMSGVRQGPDLYTLFSNNPSLLSGDNIHPTTAGYAAAIALWATAMDWIYE